MAVRCYKSTVEADFSSFFVVPVSLQEKTIFRFPMYNLPNAFFMVFKVSEQDCDLLLRQRLPGLVVKDHKNLFIHSTVLLMRNGWLLYIYWF